MSMLPNGSNSLDNLSHYGLHLHDWIMELILGRFRSRQVVLQLLIAFLGLSQSWAQSNQADLVRGVVRDQTGAAVVSAKVVLRGEPSATQVTNEQGEFAFSPALREAAQVEVSVDSRLEWWSGGRDQVEWRLFSGRQCRDKRSRSVPTEQARGG